MTGSTAPQCCAPTVDDQARDVGALGYVARASGLDHDARHAHPFCQETTTVPAVTQTSGDVLARFLVRAGEVQTSVTLLENLLARGAIGAFSGTEPNRIPAGRHSGETWWRAGAAPSPTASRSPRTVS